MKARRPFSDDHVVGCAALVKEISQREAKILIDLIDEPGDAGSAQIGIDKDDAFAG
jgi:hypothetical protein